MRNPSVNSSAVTVVDYGMGNLHSLTSALEYLGARVMVSGDPRAVAGSSTLVLPGVGAFPAAISTIRERHLDDAIFDALVKPETKLLGICLGMQLLGRSSTEDVGGTGLGILDFGVEEFREAKKTRLQLPHVGFNTVFHNPRSPLFQNLGESADYYFVHEFRAGIGSSLANESSATYGEDFLAAVDSGRVFGTQFHPEKSQTNGLLVLRNFLDI